MKAKLLNSNMYLLNDKVGDILEAIDYDSLGVELYCSYAEKKGWLFFPYSFVEIIDKKQQLAKIVNISEGKFNSEYPLTESEAFKIDQHYNNTNGSLYKFAQDHGLNAYEFDCIKRIVRCRKKGQFKEDLEKTKRVIDLYLKEYEPHS